MAQSISLKYEVKFTLNTDPVTITYTDLIASLYNSEYGLTLADVLGILKITTPSGVVYKNTGWDTDDYSSPDIDGGTPDWALSGIEVPLNDEGVPYPGTYIVEIKMSFSGGSETSMEETYSFSYDYESPEAELDIASDCKYSTLTVTDETDYKVTHGNGSFDPVNILTNDRDITVRYPLSAGDPPGSIPNATSHATPFVVGPNVWTGNFDIYMTVDLLYELETWDDGDGKLVIVDAITTEEDHTVKCDECSCAFYACIKQVDDRYQQALIQDFAESDRLLRLRSDINFYWGLYQMAIRCDQETGWICSKLQQLVQSENCSCDTSENGASVEVIPWSEIGGGGGGGTVNQWYSGSGIPNPALGSDGDFYLRTATGDVYKKATGAWAIIMNIMGEDGEDGDAGFAVLYAAYATPTTTPSNNYVTPQILAQYTIDNTPTIFVENNRDMVRIIADCYMFNKSMGNGAGFYITVNGVEFVRVFADHETQYALSGLVRLQVDLMRQTATSWHGRVTGLIGGRRGMTGAKIWDVYTNQLNAAADLEIKVYGYCTDNNQTGGTYDTRIGLWNWQVKYYPAKLTVSPGPPPDDTTPNFINKAVFIATVGQTQFDVTGFTLNSSYTVFVDGMLVSSGHSRDGNSVIFDTGMTGGEEVVIIN